MGDQGKALVGAPSASIAAGNTFASWALDAGKPIVWLQDPLGHASSETTVSLTTTGSNFGGERRWFVCDLSGDRVRKLYWCPVKGRDGGGWYERTAIDHSYPTQRLGHADRPILRAPRIRRKLGSEHGMNEPDKPKGMH